MRRSVSFIAPAMAVLALLGGACGSDNEPAGSASTTMPSEPTSSTVTETTASTMVTTAPASVTMAGEVVTTTKLVAVAAGLCAAAAQAPTDKPAAERTFQSRSHDGLHLIARGLQDRDRAASATLLETKQKVEADFSGSTPGPQVATDLRQLAEVTRASLAHFSVTVDSCPPGM